MPEWARDMVEERIAEAATVLRRLPPVSVAGYFGTWPEIQRTAKELAAAGGGAPPPGGAKAGGGGEKLCYRFGIRRPTAHRRWEYALSVIVWRLNGREMHHRRGRRFVVARVE